MKAAGSSYFYRFLFTVPITMVYTYVYNKFKGALLPALLLHTCSNAANSVTAQAWDTPISNIDGDLAIAITWGISAVIILIISKGTLGAPAHTHVVDPV